MNWDVELISGKFLGRNGGTTTGAIKAVDYFTDLNTRHGLKLLATNNSWGGGASATGCSTLSTEAERPGSCSSRRPATEATTAWATTHAGETPAQIRSALVRGAVATGSLSGKTVTGGRLDVSGF